MSTPEQREQRRQRRSARKVAAERQAKRRRQLTLLGGALAVALLAALAIIVLPNLSDSASGDVEIAEPVSAEIPTEGRVMGNPDATVTVVEWGDYQ